MLGNMLALDRPGKKHMDISRIPALRANRFGPSGHSLAIAGYSREHDPG